MRSRPARRRSVHEAAPSSAQLVAAIVELRQQAALQTPSAQAAPQHVPRGPGGDILSIDYDIFALTETLHQDVTQRSCGPDCVVEHVDGEGKGEGDGGGELSSAAERAAIQTVEHSFAATGLCGGTLGLDPAIINTFAALALRSYATRRHTMAATEVAAAARMAKPTAPRMPPYHSAFHFKDDGPERPAV